MGIFHHDLTRSQRIPETVRQADDLFVSMGVRVPCDRCHAAEAQVEVVTAAGLGLCANTTTGNTATRSSRLVTSFAHGQGNMLEHAAVLGAATGMRSTVALTALILRRSDGLPAVLRHPAARLIAATADGAELVVDKLPGRPHVDRAVAFPGRGTIAASHGLPIRETTPAS